MKIGRRNKKGMVEDWGERMIDMARIETFDLRNRRIGHTDDILVDGQGERDEGGNN